MIWSGADINTIVIEIKCTQPTPPTPIQEKKSSSMKPGPGAKNAGDCWFINHREKKKKEITENVECFIFQKYLYHNILKLIYPKERLNTNKHPFLLLVCTATQIFTVWSQATPLTQKIQNQGPPWNHRSRQAATSEASSVTSVCLVLLRWRKSQGGVRKTLYKKPFIPVERCLGMVSQGSFWIPAAIFNL